MPIIVHSSNPLLSNHHQDASIGKVAVFQIPITLWLMQHLRGSISAIDPRRLVGLMSLENGCFNHLQSNGEISWWRRISRVVAVYILPFVCQVVHQPTTRMYPVCSCRISLKTLVFGCSASCPLSHGYSLIFCRVSSTLPHSITSAALVRKLFNKRSRRT